MRLLCVLALCAGVSSFAATPAAGGSYAVTGRAELQLELTDPEDLIRVPAIKGPVFNQRVDSQAGGVKLVTIATALKPTVSRKAYARPAPATGGPSGLAQQITKDSQYIHQASKAIMDWVANNIAYGPPEGGADTAANALATSRASCAGRAALAVQLCQQAGIDAREIRGYLFAREPVAGILPGQFHRWLESRVPDVGWLPTDIGCSVHFVDPFHLVCQVADRPVDQARGPVRTLADLGITCVRKRQYLDLIEVDGAGARGDAVFFHRLDRIQSAAVISGSVEDENGRPFVPAAAVLRDGRVRRERALTDGGRFSFPAIPPGTYSLSIETAGRLLWTVPVQAHDRSIVVRDIVLASDLRRIGPRDGDPTKEGE